MTMSRVCNLRFKLDSVKRLNFIGVWFSWLQFTNLWFDGQGGSGTLAHHESIPRFDALASL
jgi:hypothetical protein